MVFSSKGSLSRLDRLTSIGMTASVPKAILNGVSLVGVLVVIWYAHNIPRSSSGHAPFAPSSQALMIFSKVRFVTFVCPLAWGYLREEKWFLIPNSWQNL